MKTYVLTLSKTFPKWHPRKGEPTYFKEKVMDAICVAHGIDRRPKGIIDGLHGYKLHTLRGNYERWEKIFEQIDQGEACLVLKQWSGVPYRSPQETIAVLTKEDGIGLQKLVFDNSMIDPLCYPIIGDGPFADELANDEELAANDGLALADWRAWFTKAPKADLSKPMAIIHFTKQRYYYHLKNIIDL